MSVTGEPDVDPPGRACPSADLLSGFFLTHGVLAALYARERRARASGSRRRCST